MLALQKDSWHRAHLTRMLAESRTGSAKQSLVGYAQAALEEQVGGDHPGAEAVRKVMRRAAGIHISRVIMLCWVELDTKPAKTRGFTPWNAGAR